MILHIINPVSIRWLWNKMKHLINPLHIVTRLLLEKCIVEWGGVENLYIYIFNAETYYWKLIKWQKNRFSSDQYFQSCICHPLWINLQIYSIWNINKPVSKLIVNSFNLIYQELILNFRFFLYLRSQVNIRVIVKTLVNYCIENKNNYSQLFMNVTPWKHISMTFFVI